MRAPSRRDVAGRAPSLERHRHPSDLLGSIILGMNDGIVTTLVFVLSVAQASGNTHRTIVIAGLAEMLAGGVAMFLGGFAAARAIREAYHYQVEVERVEIRQEPEEERAEVAEMYRARGFGGHLLEDIVRHVTSDPDRWLRVMVRDELGAPPEEGSPTWRVGLAVGLSFIAGALVPLLPFFSHISYGRVVAIVASVGVLFLTGASRARYSQKSWWQSAAEMVIIGLAGAGAGLGIGAILSSTGQ